MAKKRRLNIQFPLAGLNRAGAYRQQPPYTSPDMSNVWPRATLEGRERGGSRPALIKSHITDLGTNIRFAYPMTLALGDNFTAWSDNFAGTSLAAAWAQASWASDTPNILPSALAAVDYTTSEGEVVRDALTIDTSSAYTVEMFITPYNGSFAGKYRLYLRLDNTTPAYATDGVQIELTMVGGDGTWAGTLKSYTGATPTTTDSGSGTIGSSDEPGWLSAVVSGTTVDVYWHGTKILTGTVDAHSGSRVGFGLNCSEAAGICLVNTFRVQYYSTSTVSGSRTMLIASADGKLFRENTYGTMTQVSTTLTLASDKPLMAVQSGQKLYIADYGLRVKGTDGTVSGSDLDATSVSDWTAHGIDPQDDVVVISAVGGNTVAGTYTIASVAAGALTLDSAPGDGTCTFRVERAPKVYDPSADTLTIFTAEGAPSLQVPTGCPLIVRFLDRIVLGGADAAPHAWYAARQGDEDDWDYSQSDSQRAVAGTASEAGTPGEPLTAIAVHSDDYMIFGCRGETWMMRGDPVYAPDLDAVSLMAGIIGPTAWCVGPEGELIFLTLNGLYALPAGGGARPIPLSRDVLPEEFQNLSPETTTVSLEFDIENHGVDVFLTPDSSNARTHWWFDWRRKTFWPISLQSDHEPTATCTLQGTNVEDSCVILGGRDGYLRRFSRLATTDCGTAFSSYVEMGPVPLAPDGEVGTIVSLDAVLAADSGNVTWTIHPSLTFEGTTTVASVATGTWVGGINASVHRPCAGQACILKLTGTSGRAWAFETATAIVAASGRRRIP
jgi:hypothetical protein